MLKLVLPFAATGLAAAALAVGAPVVAHASGPTGCQVFGGPTPDQHLGPGHHSFTDSSNNCVVFDNANDTAFLNDSNLNLMFIGGTNNTVNDFNHSNSNLVEFDPSSSGNTLSANRANDNGVFFSAGDVADTITLLGTTNDAIIITGSGLFADVVDPNAGGNTCTVNAADAGTGTRNNPAIVIC